MKRKLIAFCLVAAVLFSLCAPVFASDAMRRYVPGEPATKGDFDEGYVYCSAQTSDPAFVKGTTAALTFKRRIATPSSNDTFFVEIYKGTADDLIAHKNLTQMDKRSYKITEFKSANNYMLTTTISLKNYSVGTYAIRYGIRNPSGNQYSGDTFYVMEMYVVASGIPATGLSCYVQDWPDENYLPVGVTGILIPMLEPYNTTTARKFTVTSSQPNVATAKIDAGYIYIKGVAVGVTTITVSCGNVKKEYMIGVGDIDDFTLSPGKTTLCVGATDTIRTIASGAVGSPIYYVWSSSDPSVATVKNGVVTAGSKPGTVTISAYCYGLTRTLTYKVNYHQLPSNTPVSTRTATQPRQAIGHCSVCGKDNCINVYEPAIFTDTVYNSWYAQHVDYVYERGLMNGVSDSKFAPNNPVTRGMVVTVLYRIAGQPKVSGSSPFSDVPAGKYYTNAVIWAQSEGVVSGFSDGKFHPDENVTREQLATILYRYSIAKGEVIQGYANLSGFPDAGSVHNYAKDGMAWAVAEGLIGGVSKNGRDYLQPTNSATRAQFATIISRYLQRIVPVG